MTDAISHIGLPPASWNSTTRTYPADLLHEVFEAQAARTPDAPAIRFRDETLSYDELNVRANQLARYLIELKVGPGSRVAVCMDRSLDMVVTLYAILKAGAAYVPIDPEYPAARVAFMLDDAGAPLLLTQGHLSGRFTDVTPAVVSVDSASERVAGRAVTNLPSEATLDGLAYVIYTSGSTGQPKGAMISHRAITNRIHWMQDAYALTPDDRVLQKTSFSFDVSVWEFFWPLLFGAQLEIAEPGGHRDSAYLARTIIEREVTTIHFVPSMLQLFLESPLASDCTSLKRVICSGEALPRALQDQFFNLIDSELHNLYGPTEAAVDVTAWACDPDSDLSFVPIGRPIANTQIHILDENMRPVPVGTAGELHIGGVQVARGYLNRAELTAERFVEDPFSDAVGGRLYKTGDLARYMADGYIEFLGRMDLQVKIRGFRVELGEIEATLDTLEGIRRAVVVSHERSSGDRELVAYVSHSDGDAMPVEYLRAQLATSLPEYMVPTTFMSVERFALTPNGKVDRSKLPDPLRVRPPLATPYVEPRREMERLVASKWREILEIDRVGIDDRFFELGGTSLQAARFVNQMQAELGQQIFVVTLFSAPSVAEYSSFLEAQYPVEVAGLVGADPAALRTASIREPISERDLSVLRDAVPTAKLGVSENEEKNPTAIFILSPPRSGTTLLRIMLAGHSDLFAASELQLLGFSTLQDRATAYAGRFSGWLDGTIRAIMEAEGCEASGAKALMQAAQDDGVSTKQFYRRLQESVRPRTLVDKSPSYALDPAALRKAESDFVEPRYIHLVRHPYPMIESFERHHMEQILYLDEHPFDSRQLAELIWTLSHRNIAEFLAGVDQERWVRLNFEDLVKDPGARMEELCERLGLQFDPAVVRPYERLDHKMVDGVYTESAPMGDPGFLARGRIDPSLAVTSTEPRGEQPPLGGPTWDLAADFGYERPASAVRTQQARRRSLGRQRDLRRSGRGRRH